MRIYPQNQPRTYVSGPLTRAFFAPARAMRDPLAVLINAKAPQRRFPANDRAASLKTVPGLALIRRGRADGDPVARGPAASRLNIQMQGGERLPDAHGPPTAHVFPETGIA